MNGPWFIETLARNGDVLHRHQLNSLPIRIGRAYDNDFILDDDYAAPRHALVDLDSHNKLVLHDLGSKNGVVKNGKRLPSLALSGDTVVRIGHTSLRVRAADFPVSAELLDRTMHGWEGALPGMAGMLLAAIVALVVTWLFDTRAFQPTLYLQALAAGVGGAVAWGGAWAFANRLFGRHARLGRHIFIIGSGAAALGVWEAASNVLAYAFALEALTRYGSHGLIALAAGIVYFHLATVKPQLRVRFRWLCVLFAVVASGLTLIANVQRSGRMADELYMGVVLPPSMRASPDHAVDAYIDQLDAMKDKIDQERGRDDDKQ
ncbi:FHA domain-containing protein [Massilia sp. S19_KUP03_FR1]|uniref:FHA domain-containing protein n=1 Tax=Massilia sp. S19_KUP03_FR1 TaxID=3025503 RepID=UPI002FCD8CEE